ncbi:MAG: YceI family protein [Bacteroidetes bacterium HGW-Bacteroidetes-3]|jgi:polyisoprenoid-binding protein YceI|nr:MAG: YceI family protein [Bacteroidetes bacterium HGW-Bacteroidetes-3]
MKKTILTTLAAVAISLTSFNASAQKLVSSTTHFKFFSSTPAENIEANNFKTVGTLETTTGEIVFSVPMQSFEFEKALMQEHFNSKKFLDTKTNPKAKLTGKITDISKVNFAKDGSYPVEVAGELTINGVTNPVKEKATIVVNNGKVALSSKLNVTLADYKIAFKAGKPSTNIAKTVEVSVEANY